MSIVVDLPTADTITLQVSQINSSPPTNENEFENAFEGRFDNDYKYRFLSFRQRLPRDYEYYGFNPLKTKIYYLKKKCSWLDKRPACKPVIGKSFNLNLPKLFEYDCSYFNHFHEVGSVTQSKLPDPRGVYGYTIYKATYPDKGYPNHDSIWWDMLLHKTHSRYTLGPDSSYFDHKNEYIRQDFNNNRNDYVHDTIKLSTRPSVEEMKELRLLKPKTVNEENENSYSIIDGGRRRKNSTKKRRKSTKRRRK
jgi:hypothetical protein